MRKVVIAGGTGFIGEFIQKRFQELGYEVSIISRQNNTSTGMINYPFKKHWKMLNFS